MKLNDLLMKMSEQDFITLVVDVCGVDFEANVRAGDIPKVLADTLVIHMSARDDQLRVVMEKGGDMKLDDLVRRMSKRDFITLVGDPVSDPDFEVDTPVSSVSDLKDRAVYGISVRDNQLRVMIGK